MSLNNLATLIAQDRRRDEETVELYRESLAIFEKVWGTEHQHVALSHNNFAAFLMARGRYREAEPHIRQAIAGWAKALGEEHSNTATAIANLAFVLHGMDRLEEAETLYRRSLAAHEKSEVGDTWTTNHLIASMNLGQLLHHLGRLDEAESRLRETEGKLRESGMSDHPLYTQLMADMGSLCVDLRRYQESEEALSRSLEKLTVTSPEHPLIALAYNALAACLAAQGRLEKADSLFASSSPDAWMSAFPSARRIAWERAFRYHESMGHLDRVAEMQASRP